MSGSKNQLVKFGGVEIVTGINTVGIIYLYYELCKLGADVNRKIGNLAGITKRINKNVNVIDAHLKEHLIKHQLEMDDDSNDNESINNDNIIISETENILLKKLQELEIRVAELEKNSNDNSKK